MTEIVCFAQRPLKILQFLRKSFLKAYYVLPTMSVRILSLAFPVFMAERSSTIRDIGFSLRWSHFALGVFGIDSNCSWISIGRIGISIIENC